jgi:hypothetical protein
VPDRFDFYLGVMENAFNDMRVMEDDMMPYSFPGDSSIQNVAVLELGAYNNTMNETISMDEGI